MNNSEEDGDEEEEEEEFFESLDRILSSSSDEEANHGARSNSPWTYDFWISEPSSVEDRRRNLLRRLGLIGEKINLDEGNSGEGEDPSGSEMNDDRDLYCTIKNLDSGEEFVVKELQDGMWKAIREVGTGRQFTMEEFDSSVIGLSPLVLEVMRRQNSEITDQNRNSDLDMSEIRSKKKESGWLKSFRTVVHRNEKRSGDERDSSSEKGGRRSSSATDDSQDGQFQYSRERVKVRHYGKTWKELTGLFLSQEIRAHRGSIWSVKFSLDGRFLASAGEDCTIQIWQIMEMASGAQLGDDGCAEFSRESSETVFLKSNSEGSSGSLNRKRISKFAAGRKSQSYDEIVLPENVFMLSEKPVCSFHGHRQGVLDLSWSKSEVGFCFTWVTLYYVEKELWDICRPFDC